MKNQAKKSKDYDALAQVIHEAKYLSKERRNQLSWTICEIPKSTRDVHSNELDEWRELHRHSNKYTGLIGGGLSKTETHTTIGTMVSYFCSVCGEKAYVCDNDFAEEFNNSVNCSKKE